MNIIKLATNIKINTLTNEIVKEDNGNEKFIKVENQLMQILLLLIKHDGKPVDKKTFIKEIWDGNNFIAEKALTKNIFKLRDVLKSNEIKNVSIETIPKKGYRLVINEDDAIVKKKKQSKYFIGIPIFLFAFVLAIFLLKKQPPEHQLQHFEVNETEKDTIIFLGDDKLKVIKVDTPKKSQK